jgi:hypothetical protein
MNTSIHKDHKRINQFQTKTKQQSIKGGLKSMRNSNQ